ncbi:Short-chain dehydrogenase/reductase SDR OS=Tsukamurella paurometabola (strain ATCC 8368 / DSM/ CCUG 35730 / CIP 100753 / JCM 10117 / KCTC 9821 / NBRC 16120/ NCIMB 702349 / NCTC 13040) OX=521096 GN=Tpau_0852 PE=3 SV=1 [Tsukamurella paurometabola]|uniref:Short-chain dehydrogenase/reductase SDR n=1 Tax=Tsukamurella paurometabola (strain ATCC 8368 / DSM 20162 / CCUG 35730 / CIP 100753 / JCM 10117 / KCTC 9821 / NBRC 16120 / NCIMB 702349 / NCTC 13040) TaxID=521096 RepID=D5UTY3_TSUPD|nr:short-chain dehydrogenase/reductase SDR [Tsukamurella paurometabola DSM 20162]SUP27363.1 Rhamnolipids biosynthesis 3-oxoacyl-[acyl-carrier-protein] reductase [Tsukamurella paurometabola]
MANNWTERDVPTQQGRVAVVTGSNTGLGFETARVLAQAGAEVVLAVRDTDKGEAARQRITAAAPESAVRVLRLDLGSLESIAAAATELHESTPRVDLLINNAGVMYPPKQSTADGFELQFGTNHLGHFAWTAQVLDLLLDVPNSRVVTVASIAHRIRAAIHFDDLQWERSYERVAAYGQSKLANLLFHYELQRRLQARPRADHGTVAIAAHPGIADTELVRNLPRALQGLQAAAPLFSHDAAHGALPQLRAATDPGALGGQYYGPDGLGERRGAPRVVTSSQQSYDLDLQHRLWAVSEQLTGIAFPV